MSRSCVCGEGVGLEGLGLHFLPGGRSEVNVGLVDGGALRLTHSLKDGNHLEGVGGTQKEWVWYKLIHGLRVDGVYALLLLG